MRGQRMTWRRNGMNGFGASLRIVTFAIAGAVIAFVLFRMLN